MARSYLQRMAAWASARNRPMRDKAHWRLSKYGLPGEKGACAAGRVQRTLTIRGTDVATAFLSWQGLSKQTRAKATHQDEVH
ncbi:hypothetical protein G3N58_02680 [Paraburkholderia sp. Ac-20342]|uniref:hypothetical protein n=1 Tax=unclassified Paraburkholderia TaxID=2615204 RepID=UPI001424068A|nr:MULTISPECIES: hypothetical protein [unclassified Paraburkholderia]MBN3845735.1 hypothetical protein [Paraburkholderia sp. Ac-20342]NIF77007.1 hypothetical protein [Paraburkholderia sp. Cy-641]